MKTFDIIPDIHGQHAKLDAALTGLGWRRSALGWIHPDPERQIVFLGDFIDRETANIPKHEHRPMFLRKLPDQSADAIPHFLADKILLGRCLLVLRRQPGTWTARPIFERKGQPNRTLGLER